MTFFFWSAVASVPLERLVHALLDALLELGRVERLAVGLGVGDAAGGGRDAAGQQGRHHRGQALAPGAGELDVVCHVTLLVWGWGSP